MLRSELEASQGCKRRHLFKENKQKSHPGPMQRHAWFSRTGFLSLWSRQKQLKGGVLVLFCCCDKKNNALAQSSIGEERVNMDDDTSRSLSSTDGSLGRNSRTLKQKLRRTMLASQAPACLDLLYMLGLFAHGGCCLPYARPFCIHWQLPTDMPRANLIRAMPQWRPPS